MSKLAGVVASTIAASLAAVGCTTSTTPRPTLATEKMSFTYPIGPCPNGTTPDPTQVYTITLGPKFDLTKPDVVKSKQAKPKGNHPKIHHPTQLDIVTNLLEVGKPGTVKIVLDGKLLNFAPQDVALTGGDKNAPNIFCGVTYAADGRSLTFTVLPKSSYPDASYTLGLIVDDSRPDSTDKLTVFIDPGVDNDGYV